MISRRSLLILAGALVATPSAAYVGARVACRSVPRNVPAFFADADYDSLKRFGEAVVAHQPQLANPNLVEALVAQTPRLVEASALNCPKTRAELVAQQCADDFANGDYEVVDKLMVSRTEMLLCASLVA